MNKKNVRVRGFILPSFQQSGITQFVLVRDNQECCFGPGAALHDCVVVRHEARQDDGIHRSPLWLFRGDLS